MQRGYADRYSRLYREHWWWRQREVVILETLRRLAPPGGFGPILDVGCGDGLLLEPLRAFGQPEGIESDEALVSEEGYRRGRIHVRPFDDSFAPGTRFGLITMLDVLEHIEDDRAALSHVESLLAPGGTLVLTVPAMMALWTHHDVFNQHRRRYDRRGLRSVLEASGFRVRELDYFFIWMVAPKLLVKGKERLFPSPPRLPDVPPAPLNRAVEQLCRLERATWGRLRWPLGSSLLAVCTRG